MVFLPTPPTPGDETAWEQSTHQIRHMLPNILGIFCPNENFGKTLAFASGNHSAAHSSLEPSGFAKFSETRTAHQRAPSCTPTPQAAALPNPQGYPGTAFVQLLKLQKIQDVLTCWIMSPAVYCTNIFRWKLRYKNGSLLFILKDLTKMISDKMNASNALLQYGWK